MDFHKSVRIWEKTPQGNSVPPPFCSKQQQRTGNKFETLCCLCNTITKRISMVTWFHHNHP